MEDLLFEKEYRKNKCHEAAGAEENPLHQPRLYGHRRCQRRGSRRRPEPESGAGVQDTGDRRQLQHQLRLLDSGTERTGPEKGGQGSG